MMAKYENIKKISDFSTNLWSQRSKLENWLNRTIAQPMSIFTNLLDAVGMSEAGILGCLLRFPRPHMLVTCRA